MLQAISIWSSEAKVTISIDRNESDLSETHISQNTRASRMPFVTEKLSISSISSKSIDNTQGTKN